MREKRTKALALALSAVLMTTLTPGVNVEAAKKTVKLNKTKATVFVGDSFKLKLKNAKGKIKWSSSNKKVATVSKKGNVKAVKAGKATITAKNSGKKYKCKVKVLEEEKTATTVQQTTVAITTAGQQSIPVAQQPAKGVESTTVAATTKTTEPTTASQQTTAEETTATEIVVETTTAEETTAEETTATEIAVETTTAEETTARETTTEETTATEETTTVEEYVDGKYKKDVDILTAIIREQREKGATVDEDLNSKQYKWDIYGRLYSIDWEGGYTTGAGEYVPPKNMSGYISFAGLDYLEELDLTGGTITGIDVSQNLYLKSLWCDNNMIEELDVTKNVNLESLSIMHNNLSELNVDNNVKLGLLCCAMNKNITELNLKNNVRIYCLGILYTGLKKIDLSNCPRLFNDDESP